jgi:exonuclease III
LATEDGGRLKLVVQISLTDASGVISIQGNLLEAPWNSEFTMASYNVENLFDQTDEERNSGYGDYRIAPNPAGQSSNWGELIDYNGSMVTFTEAKIRGIERAILSIEPEGPAYINLQEIESEAGLAQLYSVMEKHGYVAYAFTRMTQDTETAVGLGVLTKFPILSTELIPVPFPATRPTTDSGPGDEVLRPIFKLTIAPRQGRVLTIYNNHWSSKGHPESYRIEYGKALSADIDKLLALDPLADYVVTGDLNCEYDEAAIIQPEHNDSAGKTGLNTYLQAQGDEKLVAEGGSKKYDLQYELPVGQRRSAWYPRTDWSSFDQVIIGTTMYDQVGYTYVDNSFSIASPLSYSQGFLFDEAGHPKRWNSNRVDNLFTRHSLGGFSDHVPVNFRVVLPERESRRPIRLVRPGRPDLRDLQVQN